MRKSIFVAVLAALCMLAAPTQAKAVTIFFDDFNRAQNSVVGNGWTSTGETSRIRTHNNSAPHASPVGGRVARVRAQDDSTSTLERTISTIGLDHPIMLSYYVHTHNLAGVEDLLEVSWKLTSDATWNILETIQPNIGWAQREWVLSTEAINSSIDVQFKVVNENGDVGRAFIDNFEVSTVPEPMTMLLFGTGMVGALARKRRKF